MTHTAVEGDSGWAAAGALKAALRSEIRARRSARPAVPPPAVPPPAVPPPAVPPPAVPPAAPGGDGPGQSSAADGLLRTAASAGLLSQSGRANEIGAVRLAAYLAMPGEPDLNAVVAAVRDCGGTVLLPVPHAGRVLGWAPDRGTRRRSPVLPVEIPDTHEVGRGAQALSGVTLILAPALAVARDGTRLGNGGGFYDTLLAEVAGRIEVLAVVHDDEVLAAGQIPREPHDVAVDGALTPTRVLRWRK